MCSILTITNKLHKLKNKLMQVREKQSKERLREYKREREIFYRFFRLPITLKFDPMAKKILI